MNDCLFCKIIAGEIPSRKLYEDEHAIAFLDIHPNNPGHTLIIPKKHSRNILDISTESLAGLAKALTIVSKAVKNAVMADGISIQANNEPAAGQVIFHTHVHIIPRFEKDGLKLWRSRKDLSAHEMDAIAEKIKKHL